MKQLKFSEPLPQLILSGKKNSTWRINDKRGIVEGDELSLCYNDGREFSKAVAIKVIEKKFKDLTEKDKEGHEKFSSDKEMYETYSRYYGFKVSPETVLKIIQFRLR